MARVDYSRRARELDVLDEYKALRGLRQGAGITDHSQLLDLPNSLRAALGLAARPTPEQLAAAIEKFTRLFNQLSDADALVAQVTWNLFQSNASEMPTVRPPADAKWLDRCEFAASRELLPWTDRDTIRRQSDRVALQLVCLLLGKQVPERSVSSPGLPPRGEHLDPYRAFADGVLAYARVLHQDRRDPALVRLRNNASLTLHVLGFHEERVQLGLWALESAQFIDDRNAILGILIDDLGWANYLLGDGVGIKNVRRAIDLGDEFDTPEDEPVRSLLLAKAHRHLGVMTSAQGQLDRTCFDRAAEILGQIEHLATREVEVDLAHLKHAEALAIATALQVNVGGVVRSTEEQELCRAALTRVREARKGFRRASDQGREAKSLVLEVRLLEALAQDEEARELSVTRDRAVAASVWSRPAGRAYITGR